MHSTSMLKVDELIISTRNVYLNCLGPRLMPHILLSSECRKGGLARLN
jgi:hypothetical protein